MPILAQQPLLKNPFVHEISDEEFQSFLNTLTNITETKLDATTVICGLDSNLKLVVLLNTLDGKFHAVTAGVVS
jgi:hypothetical protein